MAITFRRGDVAILEVVVLDRGRRGARRLAGFLFGELMLFACSTHHQFLLIGRIDRNQPTTAFDLNVTAFEQHNSGC